MVYSTQRARRRVALLRLDSVSEEQLKRVRQRIDANLRSGNALRRPPLQNADEPDFLFFAEAP